MGRRFEIGERVTIIASDPYFHGLEGVVEEEREIQYVMETEVFYKYWVRITRRPYDSVEFWSWELSDLQGVSK